MNMFIARCSSRAGTAILKGGDEFLAGAIIHKIEVFVADGFRREDFSGAIDDNIDRLFRLRQRNLTDCDAAKQDR